MATPEQQISEAAGRGEVATFTDRPAIAAGVLRALACQVPPPPCGVRVRGARIEGPLDLTDCSLRALVLEDCEITDPVDLTGAHVGRVSLKGSRFSGLVVRGAKIDGMLDLSFCSPLDGVARLDAHNARILGGLLAEDVKLKSPPPRPKDQVPAWEHNWAVDLTEAYVDCGCMFYGEGTVLDGGVSLDCAYIGGGLSFRAARVIAGEGDSFHPGDAIRGPNVEVEGDFHMNFGFRSEGRMFLLGARVGNRLSISGKLSGTTQGYDWNGRPAAYTTAALQLDYLTTGAGFLIYDSEVEGQVGFNNATIGKNVSFTGTKFLRPPSGATSAIVANNTTVGTEFSFGDGRKSPAVSEGKIVLRGMKIGGELNLTGFGAAAKDLDIDLTGLQSAGIVMPKAD